MVRDFRKIAQCKRCLVREQFDRAFADFNEAITIDPKYADAFYNRGIAYAQTGQYDRALADFNEAIGLDPKNADFFANRGSAYLMKGENERAIADYDEAMRLNPKHPQALRGKIIAARDDLRGAEANTLIKAAEVVAKNDAAAKTHLGKFGRIRTKDGSIVALSMVRWGVIRRVLVRVFPRLLLTHFVPRYEIAVYDAPTTFGFMPDLTILYADEETAVRGWHELARIIERSGLNGLSGPNDPRKEAWFSGVPAKERKLVGHAGGVRNFKTTDPIDDAELMEVAWFALRNTKGERLTYVPGDGHITIMRNGAPAKVTTSKEFDPTKIGATIKLRNNKTGREDTWRVDHASIDEITAARGNTT